MAAHQVSGLGQRHSRGSLKQHRRGTKGADQEEDVLLLELNQMSQESDCKNSEKGSNPGNQNFFQQDTRGTFPLPPRIFMKKLRILLPRILCRNLSGKRVEPWFFQNRFRPCYCNLGIPKPFWNFNNSKISPFKEMGPLTFILKEVRS